MVNIPIIHKIETSILDTIVSDSLLHADDGELFIEYTEIESILFDDNKIRNASFNTRSGFGLRSVYGETTAYSHSSKIDKESLLRAKNIVTSVPSTKKHVVDLGLNKQAKHNIYTSINPIDQLAFDNKVKLLAEINEYIRANNNKVRQVSISLYGECQHVQIIKPGGIILTDTRPLVRLNINAILEHNNRMESGSWGIGGRAVYDNFITKEAWQKAANEALRQAEVNMSSIDSPAGELEVVLGPGWPGVLLHEAVGHGLEGDFNRKKTSTFSGMMGKQVAAKGVTVIDDGTISHRRGSLNIDDEGTATKRNILIEDGILVGYMQDRLNARLMNMQPTGNGRRESYMHTPMPRMTNTFMLSGNAKKDDMISSVKKGIYAANFGGGQVDITSGNFVFSASEAYLIENGKITAPVKGTTLIGNGPDVMKKIVAIGDDLSMDEGIGTCGKAGQSVPVGVGQPSLLIKSMTVGGTAV
jgi:TldD protein